MGRPGIRVAVIVGMWAVVGVGCSNGSGSEVSSDTAGDVDRSDALDTTSEDGGGEGEDGGGGADGAATDAREDALDGSADGSAGDGSTGGDTSTGPKARWAALIGTGGGDLVTAVAPADDGGVYAAGYVPAALPGETYRGGAGDVFVAKYTASGDHDWLESLGGEGLELANDVAVAAGGGVYVVGDTVSDLGPHDYEKPLRDGFVAKYGPDGTRSWVRGIGEPGRDVLNAAAVGPEGKLYVAGTTENALDGESFNGGETDGFVARFDPLGTRESLQLVGDSADETVKGIAVGEQGHLYATGTTTGAFGSTSHSGGEDLYLVRLDGESRAWVELVGTDTDEGGLDVAVGTDGGVYVSGSAEGAVAGQSYAGGGADALLVKFDASGNRSWLRLYGTSGPDLFSGIQSVDVGGVVAVGGAGAGLGGAYQGGTQDALVGRIGSGGAAGWFSAIGTSGSDVGAGVAVDPGARIYIGGATSGSLDGASYNGGGSDGFVASFDWK